MTYSTAEGEFEIDIDGNERRVYKPMLRAPSQSELAYNDNLEYYEHDPYQEYPHCPFDLGVRLIKIKGSLHSCPCCGGTFSVSKNKKK